MKHSYLTSINKQFDYYKRLGDKTFEQLNLSELQREFKTDSNSIAIIVMHISGNMLSRWTDFLISDGEKPWRQRDLEFEDCFNSKADIIDAWEQGWNCLFNVIQSLSIEDLERIVYIRNQGHTVTEAINRQMMHYAYHIGQIVFLGKLIKGSDWVSLSIPKGHSSSYNKEKFNTIKSRQHFTDDL
ncbi:hypothetical protein A9Q87_11320 [Flavobacteriales bacterium 34_180_T64]|nr:hypothetical protein A9Q87_11320 [Flavobacteriales bacterium 34_180_T64]